MNTKLVVRHPVPSLNRLFAMNPWQRRREKQLTQNAFAYALRDSGADYSILTTFAQNTLLIASNMPDSSLTIPLKKLRLKPHKLRCAKSPKNAPKLK